MKVVGGRAGVGQGSGVGCGSDLLSERTWTRYAWSFKMAGVSSDGTRKRWTAVVLTCQNKTSAHTFQKGK